MKTRLITLPFLAASLIASAKLQAETSPEIQKQIDEISQLLKPAETDAPEVKTAKSRMRSLPTNLQGMVDRRQFGDFPEYTAESMGAGVNAIPGLVEKLAAFRKTALQEAERRDTVELAEGEALMKEVGELLKSAKKAEELDGVLLKLSKRKSSDYRESPKLSALNRQMQSASQIVGNWQEYLIAKETGDDQGALRNLQEVSSALSSTPIIPRSVVLRLLNPSAHKPSTDGSDSADDDQTAISIESITAALTESGDSAAALKQLKEIPGTLSSRSDDSSLLRTLQSIENLRLLEPSMAEAEVMANARTINQNSQNQNRLVYNRALDQIVLNSIAGNYSMEVPSSKTSTPRKVLESIAESAAARQDWSQLRKAIGSLENSTYGSSGQDYSRRSNDLRLISYLELGKSAEARGDLEAAATAYLEASGIDGFYVRKDLAYGKLAELKQKAPDKLEPILAKAEERRQRAETARYSAEIESRERMMMNRMGGPQYPDRMGGRMDLTAMKPLVQEVVAEFLKEKRLEAAKPEEAAPTAKPDAPAPKKD